MKREPTIPLAAPLALWVFAAASCGEPAREPAGSAAGTAPMASPYFGQPPPGLTPERFAPGVVSTDAVELNGVFSPDLTEFFFARLVDGVQTMHHAVLREDGTWSDPRPLLLFPGGTRAVADDMAVSPDGERLYFLGRHPHPGDPEGRSTDIWVSRRVDGACRTSCGSV